MCLLPSLLSPGTNARRLIPKMLPCTNPGIGAEYPPEIPLHVLDIPTGTFTSSSIGFLFLSPRYLFLFLFYYPCFQPLASNGHFLISCAMFCSLWFLLFIPFCYSLSSISLNFPTLTNLLLTRDPVPFHA